MVLYLTLDPCMRQGQVQHTSSCLFPCHSVPFSYKPPFGTLCLGSGVHINGYITLPDGSKELWVAKRSSNKPTWPGKLDHIAAGGQPHGLRWDVLHCF